jgi:hypothetical protein
MFSRRISGAKESFWRKADAYEVAFFQKALSVRFCHPNFIRYADCNEEIRWQWRSEE